MSSVLTIKINNNMNDEILRELAKKQIGYERHKELVGKRKADSILYHWMQGYKYAKSEQSK